MSAYPTFEDYRVSVEVPSTFFSDPEIRRRQVVKDRTGMPSVVAGRFAYMFKFTLPDGSAPIAVRCFKQEIPDVIARYSAIDGFLRTLKSDFFVDFVVSAPSPSDPMGGVLVGTQRLPVVRMDWVEGDTLTTYVERHLTDAAALGRLRDALLRYAQLTERHGFSHGDLHPDNILVPGGVPRLVDYDGLFVPALAGMQGAVAGQADFQSPARMRAPAAFRADIDRFSLLVLDLSLAALQSSPALHTRRTPGEGLLLGQADFDNPSTSRLLREMEMIPAITGLTRVFRDACARPLDQLPTLDIFHLAEGPGVPAAIVQIPLSVRLGVVWDRLKAQAPTLRESVRKMLAALSRTKQSPRDRPLWYVPMMLGLTAVYLLFELGFNARLLDITGSWVADEEVFAVERFGRLLSGVALALAIWGMLPAFSARRPRTRFYLIVMLMVSAPTSIFFVYTQEIQLIDRIAERSDAATRRLGSHLQVIKQSWLWRERSTVRPPDHKAYLALFPFMEAANVEAAPAFFERELGRVREAPVPAGFLFRLRDPVSTFGDFGRNSDIGRQAVKFVYVPPIALGFSLLGAMFHLWKVTSYGLRTFLPRFSWPHGTALLFAAIWALAPLLVENNTTRRPEVIANLDVVRAHYGPVWGRLIRYGSIWVMQAQPLYYPVAETFRRYPLFDNDFKARWGDICASLSQAAVGGSLEHATRSVTPNHC